MRSKSGKRYKNDNVKKSDNISRNKKGKTKKNKKLIPLIVLVIIIGIIVGIVVHMFTRYNHSELSSADLGINENGLSSNKYVNIALFGVDSRKNSFKGLSDSIMVLTLDYETKTIKLSSFMRDSVVKIDGYGYEKQTHAYSYGGAQLAVKTLNTNYDLDIKEYVTINFLGLEKVIDKMGGVTVDVGSNEVDEINKYIKQLNETNGGTEVSGLTKSGKQVLNGRQAVSYSRIRKVGNGDSQRTERQREVMEQIIEKLQDMSHTDLVSLVYDFMPYVETSLSANELINTASDYNVFKNAKVEQFRYPYKYTSAKIDGSSVVKPTTLETNVQELIKFIYNKDEYEVSNTVKEISTVIENK